MNITLLRNRITRPGVGLAHGGILREGRAASMKDC